MTHHRPHTTHRPRTAAAIAALALVLLSGCARDQDGVFAPASSHHQLPPAVAEPTAPTAETTLPPAEATVDRTDPHQVAQAAVRIWFTWNTDVDTGPNNAAARTAPLLTPAFAHSVLATGSNNPGSQWLTWAQHKAIVTPTIRVLPDQGAPQSADRKYFVFEVTQTAHTPTGNQVGAPVTTSAWVICVRSDDRWQVSQLTER
ncbi:MULTISPECIES: hypothetical protein [Actinomycetes]|uniref:hypothetical protein n=1 Tax=Actinomycetes TaxID=1760 RepID=UPI00068CD076|nr:MULTISPECIES: hypothetical protein [Actinomycetes]